ncbi:MAG: hypothetical protein QOD30_1321, partial [Actinomycetota bacterium]|nr:hypothetical protein [Actinomycetota bacterium]
PSGLGYWLVAADGGVFSFGDAAFLGSLGERPIPHAVVGMARTPGGAGYWLAAADGGVFTFGDAPFVGSAGGSHLRDRVVSIESTPVGFGFWLVTATGAVLAFGSAQQWGDLTTNRPSQPVVGMTATPAGDGYWLATSDGGVFTFGGAKFAGSLGDRRLDEPVVGIDTAGVGAYWLATRDGAVYSFGGARYAGGATSTCKDAVLGMSARRGGGYWLVTGPLAGADVSSSDPLARTAAESAQITSLLRLRQGCEPGASPRAGALAHPLPGSHVTTGYGWRTHPIYHRPQLHTGTDFAGRSTAFAAAGGTVVDVRSRAGYGLTVVIDHGNGVGTVYAHLASAAVRAGQSIAQGATVGAVGHSGDATGNHLHFEVRAHGVTSDPLSWL